jgi:hypothetical protein
MASLAFAAPRGKHCPEDVQFAGTISYFAELTVPLQGDVSTLR